MKNGFQMGNMWYNEPQSIDTACDVLSDIMMTQASSQYGGLTIPEIDRLLAPYAEKSFNRYKEELFNETLYIAGGGLIIDKDSKAIEDVARERTIRDIENGIQGFEMKFNSVSSSRGDYPFLTFTFGEDIENPWSREIASALLKVRKGGQGKHGFKQPVVFPKLVFLYNEEFHGKGKPYEYLFDEAIDCSSVAMYPDFLSLSGDSYVSDIYKKYKKIISPMGQLSVA